MHDAPPSSSGDDPEAALRSVRERFLADFSSRCDTVAGLLDRSALAPSGAERDEARQLIHKMAGLAGTIGFPAVTDRARELEDLLTRGPADLSGADAALTRMRAALEEDLARPAPDWAALPRPETPAVSVVLVEDDADQRVLIGAWLRRAGCAVTDVTRGDEAVEAIRGRRPRIVLLDVDLPGMNGLEVCRALRTDAELHEIPVIFLTGLSSPADRVAGLAVGGDDYVLKPVDPTELRLRIELALRRRAVRVAPPAGVLAYDAFLEAVRDVLAQDRASLTLIRLPPDREADATAALAHEVRRRDLVGRYDARHALLLMPGTAAAEAAERVTTLAAVLGRRELPIAGGVAGSDRGADFRVLLEHADEALAAARYQRRTVALYGEQREEPAAAPVTVLVVEDDPDVMRILDSRLRAAGYRTVLAFDGQQAIDAMKAAPPDLALLDLMLPKLTGFEVLSALKLAGGRRPKTVVVSARGLEADVTRAFELGADDYVTKPFGPEELLARLARLQR